MAVKYQDIKDEITKHEEELKELQASIQPAIDEIRSGIALEEAEHIGSIHALQKMLGEEPLQSPNGEEPQLASRVRRRSCKSGEMSSTVLGVLQSSAHRMSSTEIQELLPGINPDLNISSVSSTLNRLYDKRLVERINGAYKGIPRYVYWVVSPTAPGESEPATAEF